MKFIATFWVLVLTAGMGFAQNIDGKAALGIHGGGNVWFGEYDKLKLGPGAELMLRYGVSRGVSLGLTAGWELLKAGTDNPDARHPLPYLKADAIPLSFVAWFNLSPGSTVSPFVYVGVGAMGYWRRTYDNSYVPERKMYTSVNIPIGFGLEAFWSRKTSFYLDLGYRVTDDWTDYSAQKNTLPDGYAVAKAGINFYFGMSDSDDEDMDGLTNGEEKKLKTDLRNPDSDGDGLTDGEEVKTYGTSPLVADTDGDGLKDGEEVRAYKTDPKKADTDGDGLNDGDEVMKYRTDPLKADTDADGLTDGAEVSMYQTNPLLSDTDGDGLSDGDEVNKYKTNPTKADTDGGTVADGPEVSRGTNPLDPSDDVPQIKLAVGTAMVLEGITFKTGSAEISPQSEEVLTKALNAMMMNKTVEAQVRGYTDNVGKRPTNVKLSQRRAESVRNWLVNRGVEPNRLTAKGFGPDNPIAPNTSPEGRAKNRRIEFFRTK